MPNDNTGLTVGNVTVQTAQYPWIETWPNNSWPNNSYVYTYPYPVSTDDYANEVEVEQREHDATLRFYRRTGKAKTARTLVREITVPLALLEWIQAKG